LFIDEAYTLDRGGSNDFGHEAVDTLVKAIEDQRGRLLVIMAGYPVEMASLMKQHPRLASRFGEPIEFPDYSSDELIRIFEKMRISEGFTLGEGTLDEVAKILDSQKKRQKSSFGNGRAVRNLFNQIKQQQASRVMKKVNAGLATPLDYFLILREDIPSSASHESTRLKSRHKRNLQSIYMEPPVVQEFGSTK